MSHLLVCPTFLVLVSLSPKFYFSRFVTLLFILTVFVLFIFQEKRKLQDETESMSDRLQEETESRRKMADKLSHERHQSQKEKECTQEVGLGSVCTK